MDSIFDNTPQGGRDLFMWLLSRMFLPVYCWLASQPVIAYRYGTRCIGTGIVGTAGNQGINPS